MDANQAAVWSALAAIFSAVAAGGSAFVAWQAKRGQTSAADFEGCLAVIKQLTEAQRAVRDAPGEHKQFEFIELLNLLETLALLVNDGRPASSTKKVAEHFLEEALSFIAVSPALADLMKKATTGDDTFSELQRFRSRRETAIRRNSKHYRDVREVGGPPITPLHAPL
jgi:hypothetical protein